MLRPLRPTSRERRFAAYDLEWYPETYQLRLIGCHDENGYRAWRTMDDFLGSILIQANSGTTYFAHAGGLADVQFLIDAFARRGNRRDYSLTGCWSGSALISLTVKRGRNRWMFADSYFLLRDSLKRIGESIGIPKLTDYQCAELPCPHVSGHCIFHAPWDDLRSYNERDCLVLYRALEAFSGEIAEFGAPMRNTIASTALTLFRTAFLRRNIATDWRLNRTARSAYIASRVEVFARDCGEANYYDVNSSFPASMRRPLPGNVLRASKSWEWGTCAMVDCEVEAPETYVPSTPHRTPAGRIYFPTGRLPRRWHTSDDLEYLLECGGRILRVHEAIAFDLFDDLAAYVDAIYSRRAASTDAFQRLLYKFLLNSLYGKFGESEEKAELIMYPKSRPRCREHAECDCVQALLPGIYRVSKRVPIPHAHVPISAAITARSRTLISRQLRAAHEAGSRIFYTDTDSIITTATISETTEIGGMKLEAQIQSGTFLSPKLYRTFPGPQIRSKGFRRLMPEQFDAIARGEPMPITRMRRIAEGLRAGETAPRDVETFKRATSHLTPEELAAYGIEANPAQPKRCLTDDGLDSRPWHISEVA